MIPVMRQITQLLWTEENSMPSVRRMRNSAHRTLVSTVEVHIGSCWRISVSHDRAGQRRMTSCPTGTQGCDQLAPDAWARRACRLCGTWSEASVGSGGLEWCGPRSCSCNKPGRRILDTLKWINRRLWKACEDWVTVVQPGCHEGWH